MESQDGRYFCKIVYDCHDLSKPIRIHRVAIFKDICNSRGNTRKIQQGGYFCHPTKSKWKVPRSRVNLTIKKMHGQSPLLQRRANTLRLDNCKSGSKFIGIEYEPCLMMMRLYQHRLALLFHVVFGNPLRQRNVCGPTASSLACESRFRFT